MEDRHLYRGKRTLTDNMWVYWDGFSGVQPNTVIEEETICQCTGLKDKNGKLIWENDILSGHIDDEFPEDETRKRVVWHENGWCPNENGLAEIDCDKNDNCNCYECLLKWLKAESEGKYEKTRY